MAIGNPYESPASHAEVGQARNLKAWPVLGLAVGLFSCGVSLLLLYYAVQLRRDYLGLSDPSPNVDEYWPAVEHVVCNITAGAAAVIGAPILIMSVYLVMKKPG